jgi:hypothetical protein
LNPKRCSYNAVENRIATAAFYFQKAIALPAIKKHPFVGNLQCIVHKSGEKTDGGRW